jgi:hypothetical protein
MKTNVVLKSSDRELFGVTIRQETKTGFLNLSDLQQAYNKQSELEGWSNKNIQEVLSYKENYYRVFYLLEKQGIINSSLNEFIEDVEKQTLIKILKKNKAYKTTGARQTKTTWCNPYVWVLVAMEMNPKLYGEVIMWLTDKLIINRIEAGNFYKELSKQLCEKFKADGDMYKNTGRALNFCIFNRHETNMRNDASAKELKELEYLEKHLSDSISAGFIKTYDEMITYLKKVWANKFGKKNPLLN